MEEPASAVAEAQARAQRDAGELDTLRNTVKDLAASIKACESSAATVGQRTHGGIHIKYGPLLENWSTVSRPCRSRIRTSPKLGKRTPQ